MDTRTLKALHGSIDKWIKIATWEGVDNGSVNCQLCKEFLRRNEHFCEGCPVAEKTNEILCNGTPYMKFILTSMHVDPDSYSNASFAYNEKSTKLAEKMALFLINLLPEEEKARYYE